MTFDLMVDGPGDAPLTLVLAHGAGAPMDTPFMNFFARGVAKAGFRTLRFEFPYMRRRRLEGKRGGPDRPQVLIDTWLATVRALDVPVNRLVIGGKSMGGRIATLCADDLGVAGIVCLGYPFHPAGRPEKLRTEHLTSLCTPCLIVQGERDVMGSKAEVQSYDLSARIELCWLPDGDHSFKPRKASGFTLEDNLAAALAALSRFVGRLG